MPYKVKKSGSGYKVTNKESGKTYSKKPLSKTKATAQMKAIYANTNEAFINKINAVFEADLTPTIHNNQLSTHNLEADKDFWVIDDKINVEHGTIDDPGDYPSRMGGSPLSSQSMVEGITGTVVLGMTPETLAEFNECFDMYGEWPESIDQYLDHIVAEHIGQYTEDKPHLHWTHTAVAGGVMFVIQSVDWM